MKLLSSPYQALREAPQKLMLLCAYLRTIGVNGCKFSQRMQASCSGKRPNILLGLSVEFSDRFEVVLLFL